ncbi:hypothetical protein Tco_1433270, partial [Tanacetum coccineum]
MRFILAPKSAKAFLTTRGPIRHGSVKLPGSPSFLVAPLVWLADVDCGGAGKGPSCFPGPLLSVVGIDVDCGRAVKRWGLDCKLPDLSRHPTDHLGIGRILLFDPTPLL